MNSYTIEQLEIGQTASFSKTVTEADVFAFAGISGDFNPLHVDAEAAAKSRFGARVAHGPITLALIAGVLGTELPGVGTIAVSNEIRYRRPVFIGDTITSRVTIAEIDKERGRVICDMEWTNQSGEKVAFGKSEMIPPDAPEV